VIDVDLLTEQFLTIRRVADEALRVLRSDGTPPSVAPMSRPSDVVCKHSWVVSGFGTEGETCSTCGAKKGTR
jgi:hypothetical protein